jgi:hypothetical protein
VIQVGELGDINPYFALREGPPEADAGWRPVTAAAVGRLIDQSPIGERWIAASLLYQGWAARLTAIYAGSVVLAGQVPDLRMSRMYYRDPRPGPVDLLAWPLDAVDAGDGWHSLYAGHLEPLAVAIRQQVRIGRHLLLGNVASALAGSLAALDRAGRARLDALITEEWARPAELAGCGRWVATPGGPRYARRTCCGYTQLPGGGRCGDCSLSWPRK